MIIADENASAVLAAIQHAVRNGHRLSPGMAEIIAKLSEGAASAARARALSGKAESLSPSFSLSPVAADWIQNGQTVAEAAGQLGITVQAVRYLLRNRRLAGRKSGTAWVINPDSVAAYRLRKGNGDRDDDSGREAHAA